MTPAASLPSQPASRPGKKPRRAGEDIESGQKPKKVNSEIRKQQNRIASRNYREKRKRKLQYLQQLLKDQGPTEQEEPQVLEQSLDNPMRSPLAEYHTPLPSSSSSVFSSSNDCDTLTSTSGNIIDPVLAETASFNTSILPPTQPFSSFGSPWHPPIYEPPPPGNMSTWNVPSWIPTLDFPHQIASRPEDLQFTPPPTQQVFEQLPTPPQQPQELVHNPELFMIGSYRPCERQNSQHQGMPGCITGQRLFALDHSIHI